MKKLKKLWEFKEIKTLNGIKYKIVLKKIKGF